MSVREAPARLPSPLRRAYASMWILTGSSIGLTGAVALTAAAPPSPAAGIGFGVSAALLAVALLLLARVTRAMERARARARPAPQPGSDAPFFTRLFHQTPSAASPSTGETAITHE